MIVSASVGFTMIFICFLDCCTGTLFFSFCRMSRRGCGKDKTPVDESNYQESGWQDMQAELWNLVHGISHAFNKGGSNGSSGNPCLHQLSKLRAPMFKGKGRPEESETWLQRIVKMLESMACPAKHWMRLATYLLKGDANTWLKFPDSVTIEIKWKDFEAVFYDKYFPDHVRDRFDREFWSLQ